MTDTFGAYLAAQRDKEIDGETLDQAIERARVTGRTVNWCGHFIYSSGELYAYNS